MVVLEVEVIDEDFEREWKKMSRVSICVLCGSMMGREGGRKGGSLTFALLRMMTMTRCIVSVVAMMGVGPARLRVGNSPSLYVPIRIKSG